MEVSILLLLLLLLLTYDYRVLEQSIGTRYKKSVKLLPHVLFFLVSLFISIFGRRLLTPLTNTYVLPFITIIIPWFNTIRMICFSSIDMSCLNYKYMISLWIVLTSYHSFATLLSLIPFSYYVLNMLPFLREIVVVIICWSQLLPYCNDLVYESANPVLLSIKSKMIGLGLDNGNNYNHNDVFSRILTGLRYMNVIGERQEDFLRALMQDSIAFLLTLLFSFVPSPLANFGIIVISMLLPLFKSAGTLTGRWSGSLDARLSNPNGTQRKDKSGLRSPVLVAFISPKTDLTSLRPAEKALLIERKRWLEYWICYYFLFLLKLYGYNMWPSIFMWICLWLQHNYFLGATVVLKGIHDTIAISIMRNNQYQAEKRKIAFINSNPNPTTYVLDTPSKNDENTEIIYKNEGHDNKNANDDNNDNDNDNDNIKNIENDDKKEL